MGLTFGELKETKLGPVSFVAGDRGLQRLAFLTLSQLKDKENFTQEEPSLKGLETVGILLTEINEYLFGIRKTFSVEIDWRMMGDFQRQVLRLTTKIPYGDLLSYGELADRLGNPQAARAVGGALGRNPMPVIIPCHRVVGSDQKLHGYTAPGGIETKRQLLKIEGHTFNDDRVVMD